MAHRLYSYKGEKGDWEIKDQRLAPAVLIPKWERWTHASTTAPGQIIAELRERIAELETERDNEHPDGRFYDN